MEPHRFKIEKPNSETVLTHVYGVTYLKMPRYICD